MFYKIFFVINICHVIQLNIYNSQFIHIIGRIAALISRLRQEFDIILDQKLNNPSYDISSNKLLNIVVLLLESDGAN